MERKKTGRKHWCRLWCLQTALCHDCHLQRRKDYDCRFGEGQGELKKFARHNRAQQSGQLYLLPGVNLQDSAEECFAPCCWLQLYAHTDSSKLQVTIKEAQGAHWQSWKEFLLFRDNLPDGIDDLIEMYGCCRQTWFQQLNTKFEKFPSFSVLICSKFGYKLFLLPNDLKWIQLYLSRVKRACQTLHFSNGQTHSHCDCTHQTQFFLNLIIGTRLSSPMFQGASDSSFKWQLIRVTQPENYLLLTWNKELNSEVM